jgi:hypothetical protein
LQKYGILSRLHEKILPRRGDVPNATENYRKALEVDAGYSNADAAKKFIAENAQKQ